MVGIDGRPVYDSLIQPENPIIDYNTRFSGLTERDFRRGEKGSSTSASGPPVKVHFLIVCFVATNMYKQYLYLTVIHSRFFFQFIHHLEIHV